MDIGRNDVVDEGSVWGISTWSFELFFLKDGCGLGIRICADQGADTVNCFRRDRLRLHFLFHSSSHEFSLRPEGSGIVLPFMVSNFLRLSSRLCNDSFSFLSSDLELIIAVEEFSCRSFSCSCFL